MILTLTSDTYSQGELYDFASTQLAQTIAQIDGVGDVDVGGSSLPAVRVDLNPQALFNQGVSLDAVRTAISDANVRKPQGALEGQRAPLAVQTNDELKTAADYQPLIVHYQNGAAVRLGDVATVSGFGAGRTQRRDDQRQTGDPADDPQTAGSQYYPDGGQHPRPPAGAAADHSGGYRPADRPGPLADHPRLAGGSGTDAGDFGGAGDPRGVPVPALGARHADPGRRRPGFLNRHLRRDVFVRLQPQ